MSEISLISI